MNSRLLLIALLFAGTMVSAEPSIQFITEDYQLTIKCSDGQVITVPVEIIKEFDFFNHFIDFFNHPEARITPYFEKHNTTFSFNGDGQFCLGCTARTLQLLIDVITTTTDQSLELTGQLQSLSSKDLESLIRVAKVLCVKQRFLEKLEKMLIPIFRHPNFITAFLDDVYLQEIMYHIDEMNWKKLILYPLHSIATNHYPLLKTAHSALLSQSPISQDKTVVVVRPDYNKVIVTDSKTGTILCSVNHAYKINKIVFNFDESLLATCSWDKTAKITDVITGQTIWTINHDNCVNAIAFTSNGKFFAISSDRIVNIIDTVTGETLYTSTHADYVSSIAFSHDGTLLATGSYDKSVKIICMKTGQTICIINHAHQVDSVAFIDAETLSVDGYSIPVAHIKPLCRPIENALIQALEAQSPRLRFEQLSGNLQKILRTFPDELQAKLIKKQTGMECFLKKIKEALKHS